MSERLERLEPGMAIPYGGDRVGRVSDELAHAFQPGDRLVVVQETGDVLHIPRSAWESATTAVDDAVSGFASLGSTDPAAVTRFYSAFAERLEDETAIGPVLEANADDVDGARTRGRSTTRLELAPAMRRDMVAGLRTWESLSTSDDPIETVRHDGWRVEVLRAGVGAVGFVFEGRPNVFADATGVLRSGNSVVFRIGSDALGTARAMMTHCVAPAMEASALPVGAVSLVDSADRAAGWAMFSDARLGLAVARGSGSAVGQLGAVARQAGIPVSLHGTGGAWMVVAADAAPGDVETAVYESLDRKVCNTLNNLVVVGGDPNLIAAGLAGLRRAADQRSAEPKLHVVGDIELDGWWREAAPIARAGGPVTEPRAEAITATEAGTEWEWEESPEITLMTTANLEEAVAAFNTYSPRFVASLISPDPGAHDQFFARVDSPFVGNGFTRWVDGQYALDKPELGLSNWQFGRLFGRAGILSGDSVYTLRTRAIQDRIDISRR